MLNEGVVISDESGRILFVNECMERLLGVPRSVLIGKTAPLRSAANSIPPR